MSVKRRIFISGALVLATIAVVRLASKILIEPDDTTDQNDSPRTINFGINEKKAPPFIDNEMHGFAIEGQFDEDHQEQLIVFGIDKQEFDSALSDSTNIFTIARKDNADMWRPMIARKALLAYLSTSDVRGEVYSFAMLIGAGTLQVAPGYLRDRQFVPFKGARQLALTNKTGLLADYPTTPVIQTIHT